MLIGLLGIFILVHSDIKVVTTSSSEKRSPETGAPFLSIQQQDSPFQHSTRQCCLFKSERHTLAQRAILCQLYARLRQPFIALEHNRCVSTQIQTPSAILVRPTALKDFIFARMLHVKCRNAPYSRGSDILRTEVPDDKVPWSVDWPEYKPLVYTHEKVLEGPVWADPDLLKTKADLKFNTIDKKVDRHSFMGEYKIVDGLPQNPMGRTGIRGRGALGRWGPNHAADPIVTCWKRDESGQVVKKNGKPVLQFVSIQRHDTGEWAIPGGMVDSGEEVSVTLKREFSEEAMNGLKLTLEEKAALEKKVNVHFKKGREVFRGYVDDPRNTDNAWMETVAVNFHDDQGDGLAKFALHAGDDAVGVQWKDVDSSLKLYASHKDFVEKAAKMNNAFW